MTTLADNFNRADSTTTIQSPSDGGADWTLDPTDAVWGITSNAGKLQTTSPTFATSRLAGFCLIRRDLGANDGEVQFTHINASTSTGTTSLWIGYDPTAKTGYYLDFTSAATWQLFRFDNSGSGFEAGTLLTFASTATAYRPGSAVWKLTRSPSGLLKVFQNGSQLGSATDTTYTGGTWVAIGKNDDVTGSGSVLTFDDWTALHVDPSPPKPICVVQGAAIQRAASW